MRNLNMMLCYIEEQEVYVGLTKCEFMRSEFKVFGWNVEGNALR